MTDPGAGPTIGVLREGPLHAALKDWLARPGDRAEVRVDRFHIDLVRADGELVEVQTGAFGPLGPKLDVLLEGHRMRIVHPIAAQRRILRVDEHGEVHGARRSPKRGGVVEIFDGLVGLPTLLDHPNLVVEVLLTAEDHVRGVTPVRRRRRTTDAGERRLVDVLDRVELRRPADLIGALPPLPPEEFTTRELAEALGCPVGLAQRAAYCLRAMELLEPAGRRGRAPLHRVPVAQG